MGHPGTKIDRGFEKVESLLLLKILGHVQDPETGERLLDDPTFRAAMDIAPALPLRKAC